MLPNADFQRGGGWNLRIGVEWRVGTESLFVFIFTSRLPFLPSSQCTNILRFHSATALSDISMLVPCHYDSMGNRRSQLPGASLASLWETVGCESISAYCIIAPTDVEVD